MLSSSGFRDALGERDLRFDRESGHVRERLLLRPELAAYEATLRRRVGRLAALEDPRLVSLETIEHDPATRRVAVVSRHVSGVRLHEVLETARARELVPDLTVALYLTGEVLEALQALQSLCALPHGALTPGRVILSQQGEVVLADYAYAEVIEAVRFAPDRLWREFGLAAWLGEPATVAADVRQTALMAIALMLGRPLKADAADRLDALVREVDEAAMIRGGRLFAAPIITWLRSALAAGHDGGFESAADAAPACAALLTDRERATARPALIEFLAELDAPLPIPADTADVPPAPWSPAEEQPASVPADDRFLAGHLDSWVPPEAPGVFPAAQDEEPPSYAHSVYEGPGPEFLPVIATEPVADEVFAQPDPSLICEPAPLSVPETITEPEETADPAAATAPSPAPEPAVAAWPPPPSPAFEVSPDGGPRVVSPSPFAAARMPVHVSPSIGGPAQPADAPEAYGSPPPPHLAAVPGAAARSVDPPGIARVVHDVASEPPIRLKTNGPIRLKEPSSHKRSGGAIGLDLTDRLDVGPADDSEEAGWSGWNLPWKYAAAAVVVLFAGIGASQMNWGTSTQVEASRPAAPAPGPPPPVATTGSIEVVSNTPGSRVLVDGKVRGVTPLTIANLAPGRHVVLVRAPNGNVRRTVKVVAGVATKLDLAVYSGWVIVSAPIELQIFESGKSIGTAGEGPIVLSAGHHTIEVRNVGLNYRSSHEIDVRPGEEARLELQPKGLANLNAVPWAEVWLDGARIGDTPLGNIAVALGTREFVFKHPQYGERRISMTITGAEPAQVSVDFTK